MSEFKEMIKEAFLGEEPYDPSPGRAVIEEAIRKFERRDRTLRFLMWFVIAFWVAMGIWAAWSFWRADSETSTKMLLLYTAAFLFAAQAVGWAKMFLFSIQKDLSVLKELKRVPLTLLEGR